MPEKDFIFLQYPHTVLIIIIGIITFLSAFVCIFIFALFNGLFLFFIASSLFLGLAILLVVLGFNFYFYKLVIEKNKIIVKRHLKEVNFCAISQIVMVIEKENVKGANCFILIDERNLKCIENSISKKNAYVEFEKNEKSETALKSFWNNEIIKLNWEQDLQPFIEMKLQENNN